jgi:hypothetical protein
VSRERQLGIGSEDSKLIVSLFVGGCGQESCLAEVGPAGEVGHLLRCQLGGVVDHRNGVAEHQFVGKDIDLGESAHTASLPASAAAGSPR